MGFSEGRFKDAVHALVANGQGQPLAHRRRDARARPDLLRLLDGDRGEIRLRENFKGLAAFLRGRERADAGFQFAEVLQPVENPALQIQRRFRMGGSGHSRSAAR